MIILRIEMRRETIHKLEAPLVQATGQIKRSIQRQSLLQ